MKTVDTKIFIDNAISVHEYSYDYSLVEYVNSKTKIKIVCGKHGVFEQTPNSHLNGRKCPNCYGLNKTTNNFIDEANDIHLKKYDYSLVEYVNSKTKIKIICPKHGIFEQTPNSHLNGRGCAVCKNENVGLRCKCDTPNFISKAIKIHGSLYDYSMVSYVNSRTKVMIICPNHGIFTQTPNSHLNGCGCLKCSNTYSDSDIFIEKSRLIHGNKYDYSLVKYFNSRTLVDIICPKHGIFKQTPANHINKCGCQKCSESKGEDAISKYLDGINIKYVREKRFRNCKSTLPLPFDFYLPNHNMLIEFDGLQHFKSSNFFGGREKLEKQQKNDEIKNSFCIENKLKLIRISYLENVGDKLVELFGV